jgi:nicotinamide-nucleotide amidase
LTIELINTGTELLLGRVLNTHQQWLCRQLSDAGYIVSRQVAIPDTAPEIEAAVREALSRADLIITTGGLGPTSDDITRDLIAKLLGKSLHEDAAAMANIQAFFDSRKRPMPDKVRVQALAPEGATVIQNAHGLAPGLAIQVNPNPFRPEGRSSWLIMLPGPPRELRPMWKDSITPLLSRIFPPASPFCCRTLRSTGIGESVIQEKIHASLASFVERGLDVGYCARSGQVDIRLAANGTESASLVSEAEKIVRDQIGNHIFGAEGDELESIIVRLLTERKQTLALAESCTGGLISNRITNVPGASVALLAGLVTYGNQAKQQFLGVPASTLVEHGAVSKPTAKEMAEGARQRTNSDYALSVTGIAGPSGGTDQKPVGTVFIGLAGPFETIVVKNYNPYDRETFKQVTADQALNLLRLKLLQSPSSSSS